MTAEDAAFPAWEILFDGKHVVGRVVAANPAEAVRQALVLFPTKATRMTARREVGA